MKILYVINALTVGGAQILLLDLAKYLNRDSNKIIVAAFRDGPLTQKFQEENIEIKILGEELFDFVACYRLIELINSFKPDIIHTHLFRATAWARFAKQLSKYDSKLITTIHGTESEAYHFVEKYMQTLSDYIVFPSKSLSDWYINTIEQLNSDRFKIIYPGVVINKAREYEKQEKVIIGTLSRLHEVKGLDNLLKAAKILYKKNLEFKINIGGGGKGKEKLFKQVKELGIEEICNFVDDIPGKAKYLESLSIFAAPSRKEAFGINICEAMERSLPVAATKVGGIPEVIEDNVTGILSKPDNPESLAQSLELLIKDFEKRKKLGENGRKRVEKLFNREEAMREHLELYESLIRTKKIHFAISSRELGGGERLAINLMQNLQKRGWIVTATCAGNPLYSKLLSMNIKCSVASMNLGGIMFAAKLLKDIKTFKPDIISSHLNKASLFSGILGKITKTKCISHIHGLNKKIYYQFSDRQVAVSNAVKQHLLEQKADESSLITINNCIDKPAVGTRSFPNRPLNISITAKLHANKGHEWALKAISEKISQIKINKIHIFGEGPERQNLENLCNNLNNIKDKVVFHGFVNDPSQYYDDIDIALLPSLGEGIPLSLLEVMRLGIPCIATNVGGIPEIIINNESGILIEPNDGKALVDAINSLSQKENYEKFSKNAFERFKKVNNQDKMIDDFENAVLDLIDK